MRYYIIAGEASGDLHASNLIKEIKKIDAQAEIRAWGGDKMKAAGADLVEHYKKMAFMGFWEVISNLRTILSYIKKCKKDILQWQPDVLVLVDYPGFNLRIAEFAHQKGIKTLYYISPQVWAWHSSRVKKFKKYVHRMLVILPFEKDFFAGWDYEVDFVGHPLLDAIENLSPEADLKKENGLSEKPVIALLPGSRNQEIKRHLPVMAAVAADFPDYQFVVAGVSHVDQSLYEQQQLQVIYDKPYQVLMLADAALVSSGTATLETALLNVPQVVCYKGGRLSYEIGKRLVNVDYIALVNLIMQREVVKELIQHDFTPEKVKQELHNILEPGNEVKMKAAYAELRKKLGEKGASSNAAKIIVAEAAK